MSERVRTDTETLGTLRDHLQRLSSEVGDACAEADRTLRQAHGKALAAVGRHQAAVDHLRADLEHCRRAPGPHRPNCAPLAAALAEAQRRLADCRTAVRRLDQALTDHAAARAGVTREVQALTSQGRNMLTARLGQLAVYLSANDFSGPSAPSASSAAVAGAAPALGALAVGQSAPAMPEGYAMVPLALIDDSETYVHGAADFKKPFCSPEDLAWSYQALHDVVLPALARGQGADYFAELDAQHGFMGTHSYSSCHHGFFNGNEAIALETRSDGRYRVLNGFHRIFVAHGAGQHAVPARIMNGPS